MTGTHTNCDDNDMRNTNVVTVSKVNGCISVVNNAGKEHEKCNRHQHTDHLPCVVIVSVDVNTVTIDVTIDDNEQPRLTTAGNNDATGRSENLRSATSKSSTTASNEVRDRSGRTFTS